MLTADTPVVGTKYDGAGRDRLGPRSSPAGCRRTSRPGYGDAAGDAKATDLGPQDVEWLGRVTGLPVVVKGVLRADDARRCVDAGAAAVWVSNHGGRQLDQAAATADCLGAVVAEVGDACEVYVDGGVRTGGTRWPPSRWGPRAVFLGRPPVYALAADGAAGVTRLLDELDEELVETLRLAGCASAARVPPGSWALTPLRRPAVNDIDVVRRALARAAADRSRARKPPLTCANANVTGATRTRFDDSRGVYVMFSSVARERRDARPRGRAAGPEAEPLHDHLNRGGSSARYGGLGSTRSLWRGGGRSSETPI